MADYIYLLENRLSSAQRDALEVARNIARTRGLTLFLVGGAVRDLTSGSPVRDLDVAVQGEVTKLKADLEKAGATVTGEFRSGQALFLRFSGGVRMEIGSTMSVSYPKPGKPVFKPATILEDLRRRDFTANAMALSLNLGSYGLLMDPLNGVADIENRQLRLVGNYGFIEDPVRMIRAARFMARLGWEMEEKTAVRYQTGKQESYISVLSEFSRGYETEEIFYEEDPLRVLKRLETEGWMKVLAPVWTSAKVNAAELDRLREIENQLQMQGVHPQAAAAYFPLLTAKLQPAEVATLKKSFPRQGFVDEIDGLEADAKDLLAQLAGKSAATPSQAWKLLMGARPEVVLSAAYSTKSSTVQAKFKSFYTEWPQARQKIPYALLQEMRIVPELPGYNDLLESLVFEIMDGKLTTPEETKAFLEPHSPPAPPPPVNLRRLRTAAKKQAKPSRSRAKKSKMDDGEDEDAVDAQLPESEPTEETHEDAPQEVPPVPPIELTQTAPPPKLKQTPATPRTIPDQPDLEAAVFAADTSLRQAPPVKTKAIKKDVQPLISPAKPVIQKAAGKAVSAPVPGKATPVEATKKQLSVTKAVAAGKAAPAKKSAGPPAANRAPAPKPVPMTEKKATSFSGRKTPLKQSAKMASPAKAAGKAKTATKLTAAAPRKR